MVNSVKRAIFVVLIGLALTGCAETAARFVQQGVYLHEAADAYVREVHAFRQWIRTECKVLIM